MCPLRLYSEAPGGTINLDLPGHFFFFFFVDEIPNLVTNHSVNVQDGLSCLGVSEH